MGLMRRRYGMENRRLLVNPSNGVLEAPLPRGDFLRAESLKVSLGLPLVLPWSRLDNFAH